MKTLTHDQEAFVRAYARIVASAPENIVRAYFDCTDDEEFYKQYPSDYTSVTDAYLMWDAARQYEAEETA
jgi:hypothetical protein